MRRIFFVTLILIMSLSALTAGDRAEFVNLGFSQDGNYFMFGFYGFDTDTVKSYSEIYTVDVERNVFVPKGITKGTYDFVVMPGQSVEGALLTLLEDNSAIRTKYAIQYLETGRLIYIRFNDDPESEENIESEENPGMNTLTFQDFITGSTYSLSLNQSLSESTPVSSAFSIDLTVKSSDSLEQKYTVGHPQFKRNNVVKYDINRVLVGPGNKSVIIIIAKIYENGNIRYMVETVKLK